MNIKQFFEDVENEYPEIMQGRFIQQNQDGSIKKEDDVIKSFISFKLRELIGEVRKEVEGMRIAKPCKELDITKCESCYQSVFYNAALDSVLQLLDEARGGK